MKSAARTITLCSMLLGTCVPVKYAFADEQVVEAKRSEKETAFANLCAQVKQTRKRPEISKDKQLDDLLWSLSNRLEEKSKWGGSDEPDDDWIRAKIKDLEIRIHVLRRGAGSETIVLIPLLLELGKYYVDQGNAAAAETCFRRADAIEKLDEFVLVPALLAQKKWTDAETLMVSRIAVDIAQYGPTSPNVAIDLRQMSEIHAAAGHDEKALRVARRAENIWRIQPEDERELLALARVFLAIGDFAAAERITRFIMARNRENRIRHIRERLSWESLSKAEMDRKVAERIADDGDLRDPIYLNAPAELGEALILQERFAEARDAYHSSKSISAPILLGLAIVLEKEHRHPEVASILRSSADLLMKPDERMHLESFLLQLVKQQKNQDSKSIPLVNLIHSRANRGCVCAMVPADDVGSSAWGVIAALGWALGLFGWWGRRSSTPGDGDRDFIASIPDNHDSSCQE